MNTIPSIPCPIWNESMENCKDVKIVTFPSATNPIMMRWGKDKRGLLWKRESGSVDRMIEYSISICSEALKEFGILQHG